MSPFFVSLLSFLLGLSIHSSLQASSDCPQHAWMSEEDHAVLQEMLELLEQEAEPSRTTRRRAASSQAQYRVKILYIVPRDGAPRADYESLIKDMAQEAQDFYEYHSGQRLTFTDPMIDLLPSDYTEAEIRAGRHTPYPADNEGLNMLTHFQMAIDDRYGYEYRTQKTLFIGITDIYVWSAWGGGGTAHIGGVELANYAWSRNNSWLKPFVHEIGHALGLAHLGDTNACLRAQGYPANQPQSFMDYRDFGQPLYEVPIVPYEVNLLTEPSFLPSCLLLRSGRPHPSNYLSAPIVCLYKSDLNSDGIVDVTDLSLLLSSWGSCEDREELCAVADINCDGQVGTEDLSLLLTDWGTSQ